MSHSPFQLDTLNQQNLLVMQAYVAQATLQKATTEEFDGWLDRIDQLEEMTPEELTQQHGQLIAMGFLKFEISGRSVGLRYQVSTKGKHAIERAVALAARELTDEDSEELMEESDEMDDCEVQESDVQPAMAQHSSDQESQSEFADAA